MVAAGCSITNLLLLQNYGAGTCTNAMDIHGTLTNAVNIGTAATITNFVKFDAVAGCVALEM